MFSGDYHTHTVYSHGKGSIEDNVVAAVKKGLKAIAVTDHGISGYPGSLNPEDFDSFMSDIERSRRLHPEIKVLAGVECNLLGESGEVDLPKEFADRLDLVLCGFHFARLPRNWKDFFGFWVPNVTGKKSTTARIAGNTDAYLRAMENNRISVISHPMRSCRVDLRTIGEAAARLGVYIELNGKSMCLTEDDLKVLYETGCEFICSSDAHEPERVGDFSAAGVYVSAGLDLSHIVNWNREPEFR